MDIVVVGLLRRHIHCIVSSFVIPCTGANNGQSVEYPHKSIIITSKHCVGSLCHVQKGERTYQFARSFNIPNSEFVCLQEKRLGNDS